jgi:hypothetical protein|tara:strand:+ start:1147 stop:1446 length:300 start_codon:yes stop_codon:yes gene_type:complete
MKITINFNDFERAFQRYNRDNHFSYEGLQALFDYLEDLESDMDKEIELDVIGLCCEYTEYESLQIFQDEYGKEYESIEDIENETIVIPINEESFIVVNF